MTSEVHSIERPPSDKSQRRPRPWGQIAIFLAGVAFCLLEFNTFLVLVGASFGETFESLIGLIFFVSILCGGYAMYLRWRAKSDEDRPKHIPWMRTANIALWSGFLALMFVRILVPAVGAGRRAAGGQTTSADGRFTLEVPGGWKGISGQIPVKFQGFAIGGPSDNVAVFVITDRREDLAVRTIEDYTQSGISRLSADLSEFKVLETMSSTVPGRPSRELFAEATAEGTKQVFLMRFYETPEYFVQMRAWGTPSVFRDNEQTLRAVLASFREVKPSE